MAINNGTYPIWANHAIRASYQVENGGIYTGNTGSGIYDMNRMEDTALCKLPISDNLKILVVGWAIDGQKVYFQPPIGNLWGGSGLKIDSYVPSNIATIFYVDGNYTNGVKQGWYVKDASEHSIEIFYIEYDLLQ